MRGLFNLHFQHNSLCNSWCYGSLIPLVNRRNIRTKKTRGKRMVPDESQKKKRIRTTQKGKEYKQISYNIISIKEETVAGWENTNKKN